MKPDTLLASLKKQEALEPETGEFPAWEMIEPGRYMPRRIRGSCRGRDLG